MELNILSSLFRVELAALDIQTGRLDAYGQGSGYGDRVYLLFSGIHFDAVVFGELHRVRPQDDAARRAAETLATSLRGQGSFTDQSTMALVCKQCGHKMAGDLEARQHAGSSGHTEFAMQK